MTDSAEPRAPLKSGAVIIGVLAVVVVLGIVAGIGVLALTGGFRGSSGPSSPSPTGSSGQSAPSVPSTPSVPSSPSVRSTPSVPSSSSVRSTPSVPSSSSVPSSPSVRSSQSSQSNPRPPVTVANLPTSGDLDWPDRQWQVSEAEFGEPLSGAAPCQTWSLDDVPVQTGFWGRSFEGESEPGRVVAYVVSYPSVADAVQALEIIATDGMACAQRLDGEQGSRLELTTPVGSGMVTDVRWQDDGDHLGSWGVARTDERIVWLWVEVATSEADWFGVADGHPMMSSLQAALQRLRTG